MGSCKPTTLGELQLYKVLQRSNLLSYYETFISQGGDDVQQLCEAGEEEFLEIMSLVGMGSKPLHVRRLQKALQEWVTQPGIFQNININYLPSQSISLTSLGIDARELIPPPQSPSKSTNSSSYNRDTSSAPPAHDGDSLNQNGRTLNGISDPTPVTGRRTHMGSQHVDTRSGSERFSSGRDQTANRSNHNSFDDDSENSDGTKVIRLLHAIVQRLVARNPSSIGGHNESEVISKLKAGGRNEDLVSALESKNQGRLETEIQKFVKTHNTDGTATSHKELLLSEAAVKLVMADKRYLLKKGDLMAVAKKVASEVESKMSSGRRRSSSHLHGSCSKNRIQEINNQLRDIKTQRQAMHKKLTEVKAAKNAAREKEYQSRLDRTSREEVVLLQERNELSQKLQTEKDANVKSTPSKKTAFSLELADLAKAHNLSFGNLQSSSASTSASWAANNDIADRSPDPNTANRSDDADQVNATNDVNSDSSSSAAILSPPRIEDFDFDKVPIDYNSADLSSDSVCVKTENDTDEATTSGFPSKPSARGLKRKHDSGNSNERTLKSTRSSNSSSDGNSD